MATDEERIAAALADLYSKGDREVAALLWRVADDYGTEHSPAVALLRAAATRLQRAARGRMYDDDYNRAAAQLAANATNGG